MTLDGARLLLAVLGAVIGLLAVLAAVLLEASRAVARQLAREDEAEEPRPVVFVRRQPARAAPSMVRPDLH